MCGHIYDEMEEHVGRSPCEKYHCPGGLSYRMSVDSNFLCDMKMASYLTACHFKETFHVTLKKWPMIIKKKRGQRRRTYFDDNLHVTSGLLVATSMHVRRSPWTM